MANLIDPSALRTTPLDKFLTVTAELGANDSPVVFTGDPINFRQKIAGSFFIKANNTNWRADTALFNLSGNAAPEIDVLLEDGAGDSIDFRCRVGGDSTTDFYKSSIFISDAAEPWHEVRFFLDWNNVSDSEILVDNAELTFDTVPTTVPADSAPSVITLFTESEASTSYAQLYLILEPDEGLSPSLSKQNWDASRGRFTSYPYETGNPWYIGRGGQLAINRFPAFYTSFQSDTAIFNERFGIEGAEGDLQYTINTGTIRVGST